MTEDVTGPTADAVLGAVPKVVGTRLLVELTATWRVEMTVDAVSYFAGMTEAEQNDYKVTYEQDKDDGWSEWEFPMKWLSPEEGDGPMGGWLNHTSAITREDVDLDDSDEHVRERIGYEGRTGTLGYGWTEQDYHDLCDNVPWLDAHRLSLDDEGEGLSPEDIARVPGPYDSPMFEV